MSKQITINDENYKKFQAALILTGEEEETVINRLVNEYAHNTFENIVGNKTVIYETTDNTIKNNISNSNQKQLFINWFRSLTRNGRFYNPVTISGYAGKLEKSCSDPIFDSVPINSIFTITDLETFIDIQNKIKNCPGYAKYDEKYHYAFTAALRKYEEFLIYQTNGNSIQEISQQTQQYYPSKKIHHWTESEDKICCKKFIEYYIIRKSNISINDFIQILSKEVPDIPQGSLRMKIQNIKYLAIQEGIEETSPVKYLSQYSMQCKEAFYQTLKEMNII